MTDQQYAYPFDPTGESNENLIVKESHIISPPDYTDFYFVVPAVGPFFEHNLVVQHWPSGRILVNGVDFVLSYKFLGASRATAKPVYGALSIYDREISGVLEVTYQTLGGPWTINEAKAAELLSNAMNNPRTTTWEQVVELPQSFPVIDHEWDLVDMVGASELKDSIDRITDTLLDQVGGGGSGENHAANRDNPHQVTKAQVGLGSVENYPVASFSEGSDPSVTNRYMTPQRAAQLIDSYLGNVVHAHIDNTENPHNVTKTQVGLSNVPNYRLANSTEAVDPLVDNRFVTPRRVHEAIQFVAIGALDDHKNDNTNPHNVTKAQVGLDRVENYSIASSTVARAGESQIHYLTPFGAMQLIEATVGEGVGDHVASTDNPHDVTKGQVGLGNVPNYSMTDSSSALVGEATDLFMSPYHTRLLIESLIGDSNDAVLDIVNDHTTDRDNPHQVTKDQVGLDRVENYSMADSIEAVIGERADLYMSPQTTAELVSDRITLALDDAFSGFVAEDSSRLEGMTLQQVSDQIHGRATTEINQVADLLTQTRDTVADNHQDYLDHAGRTDNPHSVTKTQVGLGLVANFGVATLEEAEDGDAAEKYMTATLVAAAIAKQAGDLVTGHSDRTDNPHNVTKVQLGLGSVEDYPMATDAQAMMPAFTTGYMSPRATHLVVDAAVTALTDDVVAPQIADVNSRIDDVDQAAEAHRALRNNPHEVTKSQVGLGSVQNFSVANASEGINAAITNRYMTPQRVNQAIANYVDSTFTDIGENLQVLGDQLTSHVENEDNPHNVTKAQVGLDSVENYGIANETQAVDSDDNARYMTPAMVAVAIQANAQSVNSQIETLFETTEEIVETTTYKSYFPEHLDNTLVYQKVAEAVIPNAIMDAIAAEPLTLFSGTYRVVEGMDDITIMQNLTVRTNPTTQELVVKEVSILDEVEPVMAANLDRGAENTTFTVWRKINGKSSDGVVVLTDRYGDVELTPESAMVSSLPGTAVVSEPRAIDFAYRLAKVIEDEIGLVVQALDA